MLTIIEELNVQHLKETLEEFSKKYTINSYQFSLNGSRYLVVIDYLTKNEERYQKSKFILEEGSKPCIVRWIETMFKHSFEKLWYETYWAIDLHGTAIYPHSRNSDVKVQYYPYAKEVLQLLTQRDDIVLIMSTSSYPDEIEIYKNQFNLDGIHFNYINENPEIDSSKGNFGHYVDKYYFNVLMDDKAGFDPTSDWYHIYKRLVEFKETNYLPNINWKRI